MKKEEIKLAIVGTRSYQDYKEFKYYLEEFQKDKCVKQIITGCANGADDLARRYAREKGIDLEVKEANWKKYGKGAGPIRNARIARECDYMIAFWDMNSHGTRNALLLAERLGKRTMTILYKY
jgi:hypothetical protein